MAGHALGISGSGELFLSLSQPRLPVIDCGQREKGDGEVENMKQRLLQDHVDKAGSHWSSFSGSVQCCGRRAHCSSGNNDLLFPVSTTTAYFLALLTQARGRGEQQRCLRGDSESSEEE